MDLILEPGRAERNYWRDLWRYRVLFYFLAWRHPHCRTVARPSLISVLGHFAF